MQGALPACLRHAADTIYTFSFCDLSCYPSGARSSHAVLLTLFIVPFPASPLPPCTWRLWASIYCRGQGGKGALAGRIGPLPSGVSYVGLSVGQVVMEASLRTARITSCWCWSGAGASNYRWFQKGATREVLTVPPEPFRVSGCESGWWERGLHRPSETSDFAQATSHL